MADAAPIYLTQTDMDRLLQPGKVLRGDAFVALHGSHSRPQITGYKLFRVRMNGGNPPASTRTS